jgi:hypothetical protein
MPPLVIALGIAAWIGGAVEGVGLWLFRPWAFRLGLTIFSQEVSPNLRWSCIPQGRVFDTPTCTVKVVEPAMCLIRERVFWSRREPRTLLPLKVMVRADGAVGEASARVYVFAIAFLIAWLAVWTSGAITSIRSDQPGAGIAFGVFAWVFVAVLVGFSIRRARRRLPQMIQELRDVAEDDAA